MLFPTLPLRAYPKLPRNAFIQTRNTKQRLSMTSLIQRKPKRTLEHCNVPVGRRLLLTMSSADRDTSSLFHRRTATLCSPCPMFAHPNHLLTLEPLAGVRVSVCLACYRSTTFDLFLNASHRICHSAQLEPPNLLAMHRNAMPAYASNNDRLKLNALVLLKVES